MPDVKDIRDCFNDINEAESYNRALALQDLRFRWGDQWPQYAINARGNERPQLTINETDAIIRKNENMVKQMRPRMQVHAVDSYADHEVAETLEGILRHIENNSHADFAYANAYSFAATCGFGYHRVLTEFTREDSFDQDFYIEPVSNPFTVYFDPAARLPDGSDGTKAIIAINMTRDKYEKIYKEKNPQSFNERGTGDGPSDWFQKNEVRIAEYFWIERIKDKLLRLSNGMNIFASQFLKNDILVAQAQQGMLSVIGDRPSYRRAAKWCKCNGAEILEAERELPFRWIQIGRAHV